MVPFCSLNRIFFLKNFILQRLKVEVCACVGWGWGEFDHNLANLEILYKLHHLLLEGIFTHPGVLYWQLVGVCVCVCVCVLVSIKPQTSLLEIL